VAILELVDFVLFKHKNEQWKNCPLDEFVMCLLYKWAKNLSSPHKLLIEKLSQKTIAYTLQPVVLNI